MEVNRLIEFSNVNEHNFPSVLRRTLVFRIESRFVEGNFLETKLKEGPKCGVFARDPSLRDFLVGGSVIAACDLQSGKKYVFPHAQICLSIPIGLAA
jgi:hypothetical protein